jgi:2-methylcitrate dehydratase PrpD
MNRAISRPSTCSETLGHFVAALNYDALPAPLARKLKLHVLDALGVAIAFREEPLARQLLDMAAADAELAACSLIGTTQRSSARTAAFVNGAMMHGFDFDDIHLDSLTHPSAVVLPAVLALAQAERVNGRTALAALAAGIEVCIRIAASGAAAMARKGVAPLSACGAFGAAAAAARVLGLSGDQTSLAIGAVSSFAAGSHEWTAASCNFRLVSAGSAASAGVIAARMAQRGFLGSRSAIEGSKGFLNAFAGAGAYQLDVIGSDLGQRWMAADLRFKSYPACDGAQAYIESAIDLRRRFQLTADDVQKVIVYVDGAAAELCQPYDAGNEVPSPERTRFSMKYAIALALSEGNVRLSHFAQDWAATHSRVCALAQRIHLESSARDNDGVRASGQLNIHTRDGHEHASNPDIARGTETPEAEAQPLIRKFFDCTASLPAAAQTAIIEHALQLETASDLHEVVPILIGAQS